MIGRDYRDYAAFKFLAQGNARYIAGGSERPSQDQLRRIRTSREGQKPFAAILSCSDSRVPVELIFDRGIGDIFVIRVAGNVMGESALASAEYAISHLETSYFVVMGHSLCGAVKAVLDWGMLPGHLSVLSERILPAVEQAVSANKGLSGDPLLIEAVKSNVWFSIETMLGASPLIMGTQIRAGSLQVIGAYYDTETGVVHWLGPHPRQAEFISS